MQRQAQGLGIPLSKPTGPVQRKFEASNIFALTVGALGIVYGDIGTSPLYALKEVFNPAHGIVLTRQNLIGVLSVVFWSLTLVVSIKYVTLILRAHNRG